MAGSEEDNKSGSGAEEAPETVPQKIYVTAFIQSILPQREPVYVITVTCVNISSPTAAHFEYGACKTMADFARLDAVLRLAHNSQLRGIVLPNKKKLLKRKLKGKGLKRKQKKMGEYLSALLTADILAESDYLQQFLLLDSMPMPALQNDGTEALSERPKNDEAETFQFSTDPQLMDEIEKNALSAMQSAIDQQQATVNRLRSASAAKPKNQEVHKKLAEQEAELSRMNEELATVTDLSETPTVSISAMSVESLTREMPVIDMPEEEAESPRQPPAAPPADDVAPSVTIDATGDEAYDSDAEAAAKPNAHENRSFRLSMVLRAKKQTLRQTVNFDQLFANGEIDGKYKMA